MARVERWVCDRCGRSSNGEGPLNWLGMSHDAGIVPPAAETMPGGGSFVTGPSLLKVYAHNRRGFGKETPKMASGKLWIIAYRDLLRNRRRWIFTLLAVALGLAMLITFNG